MEEEQEQEETSSEENTAADTTSIADGAASAFDLSGVIEPFTAYGLPEPLGQETTWIRQATVWTCEEEGVLQEADVLLHGGQIVAVGPNLQPAQLLPAGVVPIEIDGRGKHITPGIIDEHTHIAVDRVGKVYGTGALWELHDGPLRRKHINLIGKTVATSQTSESNLSV